MSNPSIRGSLGNQPVSPLWLRKVSGSEDKRPNIVTNDVPISLTAQEIPSVSKLQARNCVIYMKNIFW